MESKNQEIESKENNVQTHPLQDKWIIWGHEINNSDWSIESYKKIYEFDTIEDYWKFFKNIHHFKDFMLFIMRGDILPIYEDKMCENGGYYSYVVPVRNLTDSIERLMTRMIGETLTDTELFGEIIGMSVSPKGQKATIKIWNKNKNTHLNFYLQDMFFTNKYRYFAHRKNQ